MEDWSTEKPPESFIAKGFSFSRALDIPEVQGYLNENSLLKELLGFGLIEGIVFVEPIMISLYPSEEHKELIKKAMQEVDAIFSFHS